MPGLPLVTGLTTAAAGTFQQIALTRDGTTGLTSVYQNGAPAFSFTDSDGLAVLADSVDPSFTSFLTVFKDEGYTAAAMTQFEASLGDIARPSVRRAIRPRRSSAPAASATDRTGRFCCTERAQNCVIRPVSRVPVPFRVVRVLLVEDSVRLNEAVATGLRKSGYAVDVAWDGSSGLYHAKSHDYDVIVLDIMLPGLDGLAVLNELRRAGRNSHVLMLTARDTVDDRVSGLRAGADDYLVKPFAFDELLARVEALIRRRHGAKNPIHCISGLRINTASRTVERDGEIIDLPARQYTLLEYFVLNAGVLLSRSQIESHLYDEMSEPMSNVVDSTVYALRKRIDRPHEPSLIQTRRGLGYVLQSNANSLVP